MQHGQASIGAVLRAVAEARPDRTAIVDGDLTLSYREFDARVDRLAHFLLRAGIGKGDRVAYIFWSQWEIMVSYHAITRIGAVVVSLNFRLTPAEIAQQVADSGAAAILYDKDFREGVASTADAAGGGMLLVTTGPKTPPARATFDEIMATTVDGPPEAGIDVSGADDSGIWFTSGTTGRPKGAVVRHSSAIAAATATGQMCAIAPDTRLLAAAPLFHRGAMEDMHLAATMVGGTHILAPRFDPRRTLELIEEHKATHAFIVPTMSRMILAEEDCGDFDLTSMRCWMSASASFPPELADELRARLRLRENVVVDAYGITESLLNTFCRADELVERPGSVGAAVPGMRVRIHDDSRGFLPDGTVGEIVTSGPTTFRTYLNDEAAFADATFSADGALWYKSGDLGYRDEGGFFYIVDRKKDMVISGGENVYCVEVENAIARHANVAEVAVVGKPDGKWGEIVVAAVAPRPGAALTEAEVLDACGELAPYKRPREIHLIEALPRNSFGKVQKAAIRESVI